MYGGPKYAVKYYLSRKFRQEKQAEWKKDNTPKAIQYYFKFCGILSLIAISTLCFYMIIIIAIGLIK